MGYRGKDIIHYGCGLVLNPDQAFTQISHAARKNIKKSEQYPIQIRRVKGTAAELNAIREIWYNPNDPNFPQSVTDKDFVYMAYVQNAERERDPERATNDARATDQARTTNSATDAQLIGAMIMIPVGQHLFLNNLTATETGKEMQIQSVLLWHAVNELKDSGYKYIDVGVSYRPNLYRFFKNWATFHYPVIFYPPQILPRIHFQPFLSRKDLSLADVNETAIQKFCLKQKYTIVPDVEYAKQILKARGVLHISSSLPDERHKDRCQIIDLTRTLPIQYGALIIGLELSEKELWNEFGCYDFVKTEYIKKVLSHPSNQISHIIDARKNVYEHYFKYFSQEDLKLESADIFYSSVKLKGELVAKYAQSLERFSVQHLFDGTTLELPCHQNLSESDIEYVYAIYRGMLNLCSEWSPTQVKGELKI